MTPPFSIRAKTRYEGLSDKLLTHYPEFEAISHRAREILTADPYNRSRAQHIKKLEAIPLGEGQRRLSLGRFRFRYDIYGQEVVLQYCGLRREDTYR